MWGVGVIGAGPGAWALHAPTLARRPDLFALVHMADDGSGEAARRFPGVRTSRGADSLCADPAVEIVVICSPPELHAAHVRAAVAAGKRGILCEKPLALDVTEAADLVQECRAAGVALVVGSHHVFDPGWGQVAAWLRGGGHRIRDVDVRMSLPPNARYHAAATGGVPAGDTGSGPSAGRGGPDLTNPQVTASVAERLVSGLLVHDLPLLRDLVPGEPVLHFARAVAPLGVCIGWGVGDVTLRSTAVMLPGGADALWRIAVTTDAARLVVDFPPAFVHAGSAAVTVEHPDGSSEQWARSDRDGYEEEWRALAEAVREGHVPDPDALVGDLAYTLALTRQVGALLRAGGAS